MQKEIYIIVFLILTGFGRIEAQLNAIVAGDAIDQGNNCYIITQDITNQAGAVWYDNPIDFDSDFTIYYQNDFGSKDANGADGMALVFKGNPTAEIGGSGGGLGYDGLTPSLVVEFDTYQNNSPDVGVLADPVFDHIAIQRDGNPFHNNAFANLAGPVQASSTSLNIEDGIPHDIKIVWTASTNIFEVYFDCELRLSLNFDIEADIFNGDETVYFGFVGSTGGLSNVHQVCFNSISFVDNLQLQDDFICQGSSRVIDASIPSGVSYNWSPVDGISNPNIPNPVLSPTSTTTYTVTISDVCGETTVEEFTLSVLPVETPFFDPVAPICSGETLSDLPNTSTNGITGTWSPALNNTQTTTYTFTPDNPCATTITLEIIVDPLRTPFFSSVDSICEGEFLPELPTTSNNGISGTWSPAINNLATTTYFFTPDASETCALSTSLQIIVNPLVVPEFDVIEPICEGEAIADLPTVSNDGISGSWAPALNNMVTTTYTFTPSPDECAVETTLVIEVEERINPVFDAIEPFCAGDVIPELSTVSLNGISGVWSPEIDNSQTTVYTFVPDTDQCANETSLVIEIIPNIIPEFDSINPICPGQIIDDLPTVSNNGISGTWFPEIDNMITTIYTFTPDLGQGCVLPTTLEIVVTDPILPNFDVIDTICSGDTLDPLPIISLDGISGVWSPALNNEETTTYTFVPDANQCAGEVSLTIEVIPFSQLSIEVEVISEPFSDNQVAVATVIGGSGVYEFQLDGGLWVEDNIFSSISGCDDHNISVRETSRCSNVASATFRILDYPKFFTPNGDTFNQSWNINCLDDQPDAKISIFDRYGKLLKVISTQGSGWDGTFTGSAMPTDDYWFKVEYFSDNGSPRTFTSHFTLKR